jgi:hypothetical protein
MRKTFIAAAVVAIALPALSQIRLPESSPAAKVTQEVGISSATISYHRPGVKGRKVWGELVPYGKVWRFGANEATTLELSHAAKVGGQSVPAGRYALFAIPGEKEWTLVLNTQAQQWGAYSHDPAKDLVRFNVAPQSGAMAEWFTIEMRPVLNNAIQVESAWERVRVPFTIEFDTPALVWKQIDDQLAASPEDPTVLLQSARYAFQTGERTDSAMAWVDKSIAVKESFWSHELKARMLEKSGNTKDAIRHLDTAITLAEGKAPAEYLDGLRKDRALWAAK